MCRVALPMWIALLLAVIPLAEPAPEFDPLRFFAGCTQGEGALKIVLRARQPISVRGRGMVQPDSSLILDQDVTRGSAAPKPRQWRLRRVAQHRYAGTLSDARGAVAGETIGNRLHLIFTSSDGSHIEQWLTLAGDGRSATNVLTAKRLGIEVARLEERIVKTDRCMAQ